MASGQIEVPEAFAECEDGAGGTVLVRRWRADAGRLAWVFGVLAVPWGYFWLRDVANALRFGGPSLTGVLVALLCLAVGALPAYLCAAIYLNRTEYGVGEGKLSVRNRPLPWGGNRTVAVADIAALFVKERAWTDSYGKARVLFRLWVVDREGRRKQLGLTLRDAHEGLYLERRLGELTGVSTRHPASGP